MTENPPIPQDPEMSFAAEIVRKKLVRWTTVKNRSIGVLTFDGEEVGTFNVVTNSPLHKKVIFWLRYNGINPGDEEVAPKSGL